jgi:hypothetical protein
MMFWTLSVAPKALTVRLDDAVEAGGIATGTLVELMVVVVAALAASSWKPPKKKKSHEDSCGDSRLGCPLQGDSSNLENIPSEIV